MKFRLIIYLYYGSSEHSVGFIISNEKRILFFKTSEDNLINYQIQCVFHVTFVNAAYRSYMLRDNI